MSPSVLALCLCLSFSLPPGDPPQDPWIAEDKVKHFVASFVITSLAASGARLSGAEAEPSVLIGAGVGAGFGAWKEMRDARRPDATFSLRDLAWDLAGVGAASAVMIQVR